MHLKLALPSALSAFVSLAVYSLRHWYEPLWLAATTSVSGGAV